MTKMALALYLPEFPMQVDTAAYPNDWYATAWLNPTGEGGIHAAYGGYLRDRPLPPGPLTGDWALTNATTEVNQAKAGGLDGFGVLLTSSTVDGSDKPSKFANAVCQAAVNLGAFTTFPVLDLSVAAISGLSAADAATLLDHYLAFASTWRETTSYVVAALHAETWTTTQWSAVVSACATLGKTVLVLGCFDTAAPADSGTYDSVMWALTMPGGRSPASNDVTTWTTRGNAVQARSRKWVHPVAFQDARPDEGVYDEACNTESLLAMHSAARGIDADHLLHWTWNDYASCSAFAPSRDKGDALLVANRHFVYWWKTPGAEPAVTTSIGRELILLSHRKQLAATKPSYPETQLMALRPGSTPARDTLEALALLSGPGTLVLQSGSTSFNFTMAAGSAAKNIPLQAGTQKAQILRAPTAPTDPTPPTLDGWSLVWSEEFEGTAIDATKWNVRTDDQSNHQGHNLASNVVVAGGTVSLKSGVNTDPATSGTKPWTSAYITTAGKWAFSEARVDVRARMTWGFGAAGQGMWPAIWFRPEDSGLGEIDLMEAWLGINDLHSTLWRDYTGTPHVSGGSEPPPFDPTAWHVWSLRKFAGSMQMFLDDVLIWDATNAATWIKEAFDRAVNWHIRLQLQVGGTYGGVPGGSTDFTKAFEIDYVRAYRKSSVNTAGAYAIVSAGQDLAAIVNAAPANSVITVGAGNFYLTAALTPADGVRIIGDAAGGTILNGSQLLTSWTADGGSRWYASGLTFGSRDATMRDGTRSVCEISALDGTNLCWDREQVWIDGVRMKRVASLAAGDAGTGDRFFQDRTTSRIYVWTNPAGHTIEMDKQPYAIKGSTTGVQLTDLTVEKCASPLQQGAISLSKATGWTFLRVHSRNNHALGYYLSDPSTIKVTYCQIYGNGQLGMGIAGKTFTSYTGTEIAHNDFHDNNQEDFYIGDWEAGGLKVSSTAGAWIHHNTFVDEKGLGIWADSSAANYCIEDNTITNAYAQAARLEISRNIIFRRNTITHSGVDIGDHYRAAHTNWHTVADSAALGISECSYVEAYANIVDTTSLNGIVALARGRTNVSASGLDHVFIHDNDITQRQTPIPTGDVGTSTVGTMIAGGLALVGAKQVLSFFTAASSWSMPATVAGQASSGLTATRLVDIRGNTYKVGDLGTTKRFVYGSGVYLTATQYAAVNPTDATATTT